MAEYRAYIIGVDGHFIRAVELLCPDDDTAKEYAKQLALAHEVELWQGPRHPERLDRIALACAFGAFGDFLSKDGRAEAPNCQIGKSGWLFTQRPDPVGRR